MANLNSKTERETFFTKTKSASNSDPINYFYALRKLKRLHAHDELVPYQIEVIGVQSDKIVMREFIDKPDTKQMVYSKLMILMDPENAVESGNVTNVVEI